MPDAARVADDVWVVPLAIAPGHMPYTLSYLVADEADGIHLIDAGWDLDGNLDAVAAAVSRFGEGRRLASVIVTHLHPDHLGLAARLRAAHGVPVVLHRREARAQAAVVARAADEGPLRGELTAWGVPEERRDGIVRGYPRAAYVRIDADVLVDDGDLLPIPGRRLRVIHTPGHTPGHMCLHDEDRGLLFSGDHVLPTVMPGVGLGGPTAHNPMERYLDRLARVREFDACEILPGHGYRFRGLSARASRIAAHHLRRAEEVAAVLSRTPDASVWEVAPQLTWSRGWDGLKRHYLVAALRQTSLHARLVRDGALPRLHAEWAR